MGSSFHRPPTVEPPVANHDAESADFVPPGEADSALASVRRIARAVPYRPILRKAEPGQEEATEADVSQPGDAAEQEADAVSDKVAGDLHDKKNGGKHEGGEKEAKDGKGDGAGAKAGDKEAEPKEEAPQIGAKLEGVGRKVYLTGDGKLTGGGRKKLGNLVDMQGMTVTDAIKARGGGGSQVRMAGPWAQRTLAETANAAAAGDETAETAIKMVKQASAKAGDHSGRSG